MSKIKRGNLSVLDIGEWFALIEVYRHGRMVLHDCKALSDFSSARLGFVTGVGNITIDGERLQLINYSEGVAVVSGVIQSITFEQNKGGESAKCCPS